MIATPNLRAVVLVQKSHPLITLQVCSWDVCCSKFTFKGRRQSIFVLFNFWVAACGAHYSTAEPSLGLRLPLSFVGEKTLRL